jgi:hypothetical protein
MPFGEDGRITLAAAKGWIARNIQKPNTSESFREARGRKEQALASLRELEFKQKSGKPVDVANVERTWCGVVMIAPAAAWPSDEMCPAHGRGGRGDGL